MFHAQRVKILPLVWVWTWTLLDDKYLDRSDKMDDVKQTIKDHERPVS